MTDTTTTRPKVRQWHEPGPDADPSPVVALEWEHTNGLPTTGAPDSDLVILGQITEGDPAPVSTPDPASPRHRPAQGYRVRPAVGWSIALSLIAQLTVAVAVRTDHAESPFTLTLSVSLAVCCVLMVAADYLSARHTR